ncbi:MAG: hypothetical protein NTY08_06140 [Proteobacteria bacterium]|nr:hypothetical protein [Pseudomonadota bacterium]
MRTPFKFAMIASSLFFSACYVHMDVLNGKKVAYVSMVTVDPPKSLAADKKISVTWCTDEEVLSTGIGDRDIGYIDQVVLKANRQYRTPYIFRPIITVSRSGAFSSTCTKLSGYIAKGS